MAAWGRVREGGNDVDEPGSVQPREMESEMPRRDRKLLQRARGLRKVLTDAERLLWSQQRRRRILGYKFKRQLVLGPYIVDFACLERKLVLELDGGQHLEQREYDLRRSQWLKERGFRVLRFWNHQVFQELEAVVRVIQNALDFPPSPTLPHADD